MAERVAARLQDEALQAAMFQLQVKQVAQLVVLDEESPPKTTHRPTQWAIEERTILA